MKLDIKSLQNRWKQWLGGRNKMFLNDFQFIILFLFVLLILSVCQTGRKLKGKLGILSGKVQLAFLLLFSYVVICSADIRCGICVAVETLISYVIARIIGGAVIKNRQVKILLGGV